MRAVFFCVLFHAKQRIAVLFFCCKRKLLCYLVFIANERCFVVLYLVACERRIFVCLQANDALMINICCKRNKGFCIVEYCKKSNFGQKTKGENGKKHKHRQKKTIQVSNFHNAAETDVNLTGRKQILIQKSRCLFFDGKTAHYLRK